MDDPQQQNRPSTTRPWTFKGAKGVTLVHPEARVLAVSSEILYDTAREPRQKLGTGSAILFEIPGRREDDKPLVHQFLFLNTPDEVSAQILERGGWR